MSATRFVQAHRGELLDGDGNPIVLRGVGVGNWMLPEGDMWAFRPTLPGRQIMTSERNGQPEQLGDASSLSYERTGAARELLCVVSCW